MSTRESRGCDESAEAIPVRRQVRRRRRNKTRGTGAEEVKRNDWPKIGEPMTSAADKSPRPRTGAPKSNAARVSSWDPFALEADDCLVAMRVIVGLLFVYEGLHTVLDDKIARRYLDSYLIIPFAYVPWWLPDLIPRSHGLLAGIHYLIAALGACVTVGFYTDRTLAMALFLRTVFFFANQSYFLNHHYAQLLFSLLVGLMNSGASRSLDAVLEGRPFMRRAYVPAWMRWSMQLLFHSMFLYAAAAKINFDWLRGQPVAEWFTHDALVNHVARWSMRAAVKAAVAPALIKTYVWWGLPYLIATGGIVWDAAAPFLGCLGESGGWPRRILLVFSVIGTLIFNCANHLHVGVGVFPVMVTALTAVLYWMRPRKVVVTRVSKAAEETKRNTSSATGTAPRAKKPRRIVHVEPVLSWRFYSVVLVMLIVLALPLRPYLIAGDPYHDGTGHFFSWRMKLTASRPIADCYVRLLDPDTGKDLLAEPYFMELNSTRIFPSSPAAAQTDNRLGAHASMRPLLSRKVYSKLLDHPYAIARVASVIRSRFEDYLCPSKEFLGRPCFAEVHMDVWRSQNFRRHQRVIGDHIDLASDGIAGTWPHLWVEPIAPVEGWHRFQTIPMIIRHLLITADEEEDDGNPCWPWKGAHRRGDKAGVRRCSIWWYRPGGGRDQHMEGGGDSWVDRLFSPTQGYNDREPCEKALGWWFDEKIVSAICEPADELAGAE